MNKHKKGKIILTVCLIFLTGLCLSASGFSKAVYTIADKPQNLAARQDAIEAGDAFPESVEAMLRKHKLEVIANTSGLGVPGDVSMHLLQTEGGAVLVVLTGEGRELDHYGDAVVKNEAGNVSAAVML